MRCSWAFSTTRTIGTLEGAETISVGLLYLGIAVVALVCVALLGSLLLWNVVLIPLPFKGLWSLVSGNGRYRFVGAWKVVDTKPWLSGTSQERE